MANPVPSSRLGGPALKRFGRNATFRASAAVDRVGLERLTRRRVYNRGFAGMPPPRWGSIYVLATCATTSPFWLAEQQPTEPPCSRKRPPPALLIDYDSK